MSFIQFESGNEKEKIRQELREARDLLLQKAKDNYNKRNNEQVKKELRGDDQWMLPSVQRKIDKLSSITSKSDKKKSKKEKKSKKNKKHKRRKTSDDSDSILEEEISKKKKHRRKIKRSSSSNTDSESDEWVEKPSILTNTIRSEAARKESENDQRPSISTVTGFKEPDKKIEREDWLGGMGGISTFTRDKKVSKKNKVETYDPSKSVRELNPYWKNGGTGLPSFQKPSEEEENGNKPYRLQSASHKSHSGWRKQPTEQSNFNRQSQTSTEIPCRSQEIERSSSSESNNESEEEKQTEATGNISIRDFLTDQQMNELGAKILKAEIMGNDVVANELRKKLENARLQRNTYKETSLSNKQNSSKSSNKVENVVLTTTDNKGISRPVQRSYKADDPWGGRAGRRLNKKAKTHDFESGERLRYFADDEKYDLKQMFEQEKFSTGAEQDQQFVDVAGRHMNPNDDLEDIFVERIQRNVSDEKVESRDRSRAIREHKELTRKLDTCDKCFYSSKMEKQLIIAMGTNVYLSLPSYEGLQVGHCLISPMQHVSCSTQLDEDVWSEVQDFLKALNQMFQSRSEDVIFFETAYYLHKRPHMVIHCVASKEFGLAPLFFKKAIQESEREWSTNKQLIELKGKDVRRGVPKGLPYFWVNFGMDRGFAHVIEEQDRFPYNFAQEIIGGMLNLDSRLWRRPRKIDNAIQKVKQFADWWKPFDVTETH